MRKDNKDNSESIKKRMRNNQLACEVWEYALVNADASYEDMHNHLLKTIKNIKESEINIASIMKKLTRNKYLESVPGPHNGVFPTSKKTCLKRPIYDPINGTMTANLNEEWKAKEEIISF